MVKNKIFINKYTLPLGMATTNTAQRIGRFPLRTNNVGQYQADTSSVSDGSGLRVSYNSVGFDTVEGSHPYEIGTVARRPYQGELHHLLRRPSEDRQKVVDVYKRMEKDLSLDQDISSLGSSSIAHVIFNNADVLKKEGLQYVSDRLQEKIELIEAAYGSGLADDGVLLAPEQAFIVRHLRGLDMITKSLYHKQPSVYDDSTQVGIHSFRRKDALSESGLYLALQPDESIPDNNALLHQ